MRLKPFLYHRPATLMEMFEIVRTCEPGQFAYVAGGTDVFIKIKQGLMRPSTVIRIKEIPELKKIEQQGQVVSIGAAVTLYQIKTSNIIQGFYPALVEAAGWVGSPQLRSMGTIGGNVCLDTRCLYYNQQNWQGTFQPCFKKGGDRCHVVKKGSRCYALFCADTPPVLLTLDARLHVAGPTGKREIPMTEFYQDDGLCCHRLQNDELIEGIEIPIKENRVSSYSRFSLRGALDFPIVGVAVNLEKSTERQVKNIRIAATGLQSQPLRLTLLEQRITESGGVMGRLEKLIEEGTQDITLLPHQGIRPSYRRDLLKVIIERALTACIAKEETRRARL